MKSFDELYAKVATLDMKTVAVCCAQDEPVLEAVKGAYEKGIARAILVGDADEIKAIAAKMNMDLTPYEIIDVKDNMEAALTAVKLVHDGKADMYMKGMIDTKSFLKSVLDKEVGLRCTVTDPATGESKNKPLSHVCVFDIEDADRLLFVTDVAFIPYPTLDDKVNIINNTVEICEACEVMNPKVAPLAAVEVVNPKMPCTVEADELRKMNDEGIIKDCLVDGPISFDMALCPEAAKHKGGTDRKVQGDADILLCPDIQAGNILYKAMVHIVRGVNGNLITGTAAPVILTSRSDEYDVKLNSIALGVVVAEYLKKKNK